MTKRQKDLLDMFNGAVKNSHRSISSFNPSPEDMGGGVYKNLKRLLRYRGAYLSHVWNKIQGRLLFVANIKVKARLFFGTEIMVPVSDSDTQSIYKFGILSSNEDGLIRYLITELKEDDVFYDVGANYGFYTSLGQALITGGEIHSFEPSASIFPYLERMTGFSKNTFLNNVALSDVGGKLTFYDCYPGNASGKSTIVAGVATEHRSGYDTVIATALTLDEYCQSHVAPRVLKIDVEGAESIVLEGGRRTLEKSSPVVAIELWSGEGLYPYSHKALKVLDSVGYKPFFLSSDGELKETNTAYLHNWLLSKQEETNFIFKKS